MSDNPQRLARWTIRTPLSGARAVKIALMYVSARAPRRHVRPAERGARAVRPRRVQPSSPSGDRDVEHVQRGDERSRSKSACRRGLSRPPRFSSFDADRDRAGTTSTSPSTGAPWQDRAKRPGFPCGGIITVEPDRTALFEPRAPDEDRVAVAHRLRRCAIMMIVLAWARLWTASITARSVRLSSALVASSRISTSGSW